MPLHDVSHIGAEAADATLSGDVTMVNANTFYDGPAVTLPPGTWMVTWKALIDVLVTTSQSYVFTGRLWDGSTVYDESENIFPVAGNWQGWTFPVNGFAIVTLAAAATLKVSVAGVRASSSAKIVREVDTNSATSHTATRLSAIKVA